MEYQLNFLSSTADERVKRHLKRFSFLLYLIIFGATIFILVRTHESQTYMAHVFEGLNADIEGKISSVEPRMLFLERKIGVRNRLRKESDIFLQHRNRPAVWRKMLVDITNALPPDLVITKLYSKAAPKGKKKQQGGPDLTIEGYTYIEGGNRDILSVDNFRGNLLFSLPLSTLYSDIKVENNRIYKEEDRLKLVFSLGLYK
ncbi:MAG: hypothetical protein HOD43_02120 [Candidatus Marinimicrobia bacterium]|jgi:hypothetical protein|nr:hypothetical protein [Candidatus Neomarinimicrobiota bacterium]MBT3632403.1 hypothetical protein [Candidatus Neomarinimicrobiota bacterium]MBT3824893.1 hypothetical protein [Candidatus Neomarinimicrobiota bacterium]MBT4131877.1 hypothetical protein [Candidatus Neomarinimicrobiota bacterium]MBT4294584.1 hypothetical protein [Candidatus Neomarinimicrobiota bacterium]